MSATNLRFFKLQPVTTALRFNEIPPPGVDIYTTATIDALVAVTATASLNARMGYIATLDAAVDVGFQANLTALYDNSVNRAPFLWGKAVWEVATPTTADASAAHRVSAKVEAKADIPLQSGLPLGAESGIAWRDTDRRRRPEAAIPWEEGLRRAADAVSSRKPSLAFPKYFQQF